MLRRLARAGGSLLRESSAPEFVHTVAAAPILGLASPLGYGHPVLLIPGFGAADASLEVMGRWLRSRGYRTYRSRVGLNVGCSERQGVRLERRLERIAADSGQRVAIVGHSRGGILAKALAAARPDLVAGIAVLGSPTRAPGRARVSHPQAVSGMLSSGHLPNLLSFRCLRGGCPPRFQRAVTGPFPKGVGFVSVYSRRDRIAPWQTCRHPAAENLEVEATHLGLAHNAEVFLALARTLPAFWPHRDRSWPALAGRQVGAVARTFALI
ncbi:MAG: esterase/lipase family protein [Sporichthyaceae bacterium]|jgi:triacylglycerol lipase